MYAYLGNSEVYAAEPSENSRRASHATPYSINKLAVSRIWPENPRVGGSIPPLATIKSKELLKNDAWSPSLFPTGSLWSAFKRTGGRRRLAAPSCSHTHSATLHRGEAVNPVLLSVLVKGGAIHVQSSDLAIPLTPELIGVLTTL